MWGKKKKENQESCFLKEDKYPRDVSGSAILDYYVDPIEHYVDYLRRYLEMTSRKEYDGTLAFNLLSYGTWGLRAKGAEAVPWIGEFLKSKDSMLSGELIHILSGFADEEGFTDKVIEVIKGLGDTKDQLEIVDTLELTKGNAKKRALTAITNSNLGNVIVDRARELLEG